MHLVDEEMDHGAIILQKEVEVKEADTLSSLEAKIHKVEHLLYLKASKLIALGKVKLQGRRIRIRGR